jgi:hypothetical protein
MSLIENKVTYEVVSRNIFKNIKDLPRELIREIYSYLDFNYNTYVITTGKRNRKLILIQKPICDAINEDDEIFFITK